MTNYISPSASKITFCHWILKCDYTYLSVEFFSSSFLEFFTFLEVYIHFFHKIWNILNTNSSKHFLSFLLFFWNTDSVCVCLLANVLWASFLLLFSHSVVVNSLRPHGLQHDMLPCPSLSPGVCASSCPLSWHHPTISSSVTLFFSCFQSFPASGPFPMIQFFPSGGQNIGASTSASVLPMNIQGWIPLGLTGLNSL